MVEKYSNDEKITRLLITSTAEDLQITKNLKRGFGRRRLESFLDRFGCEIVELIDGPKTEPVDEFE